MNHWVFRIQDDRFYTHFFPIIFKIAQFNVQKWTIDYGSFYSSMMDIMDMMTYVPYDMKKSMRNGAPGWLLKFETFFQFSLIIKQMLAFRFPTQHFICEIHLGGQTQCFVCCLQHSMPCICSWAN